MVGLTGDRPNQLVRVIARGTSPWKLMREVDLLPRSDNRPWKIGDVIGLVDDKWVEVADVSSTKVTATITTISGGTPE
jgi:starvation-inducible outer membrane lipoprotein